MRRSSSPESLHSIQAPQNDEQVRRSSDAPIPISERRRSSRHWGPRAANYANRFARRSTDARRQTSTSAASSSPGDAGKKKPAGLKDPLLVLRRSVFASWINVLLLLVPVGIASHPAHFPDVAVFIINFFAIVPLAKLLGYATEQLALHLGDAIGGLLNATFGNAVELLVGILALVKGEIEIVQTSLVGSILSNLLLVGGCCFFFGGIKNNEQIFNTHAAQSYGSLLAMAILATLLPAAYNSLNAKGSELKSGTLTMSHVTAIFLLVIYIAYLFFQLKTHANLFSAVPLEERREAARKPQENSDNTNEGGNAANVDGARAASNEESMTESPRDITIGATPAHSQTAATSTAELVRNNADIVEETKEPANAEATAIEAKSEEDGDEDEEEVELTVLAAIALLVIVTGLTGVCAEFLVDSIDGLTDKWNLSPSFVGMILLPIVGNAAEHVTAVTVAIRNKMDLALGVAVGSSIQIALFVLPLLCILGWIIDKPMTIYFSPFTTVVLFVTVLLVNYIIGDGRTNWLEGLVLIIAYVIVGVAYFLYPKDMDTSSSTLGSSG
ncbi:hypothetical protein IW140_005456 [Coemansia sp. RSA 1813]|nr:hypothetical protein EV178_005430 [Coemansia sp. RSA 1646]KAJ1766308.1 hypothetical protein LPJ74_005948 [Coemansia sp. RSA 1843]KAJ2086762.1 hypothetical protein IW138_005440 [Coemansia sp. RSA 986]KAJ2211564.1 hypothetical protein EV179_005375 [Coemansia sp. RSA 487]KAJ2565116.1 hypothetical protein IW140_005456 [Coemansia sp. RSA 1813]